MKTTYALAAAAALMLAACNSSAEEDATTGTGATAESPAADAAMTPEASGNIV